MMNKLFAVGLMASTALAAANSSPVLKSRQLVEIPCSETGMKDCGDGCIDIGWSCCSTGEGGCGPGLYCTETGCCPIGEICSGGGGVITNDITYTVTNTDTISVDVPTDTVSVEVPTNTYTTPEDSVPPASSTPTPSASATASYTYPTQEVPTFTGAADRNVGSGIASFAGVIAGLLIL